MNTATRIQFGTTVASFPRGGSRRVRKAVLPVAGLGTRSLPATKAVPKEMLTVVDKPVIQYAVEEAQASGIEDIIFVTSRGKTAIQDHFDAAPELYRTLEQRGKADALRAARAAELPAGRFSFVTQPAPLGLGHAVWCARNLIGDEPFAVLLPDEIFLSKTPVLRQLLSTYAQVGGNVLAVADVPREQTSRYGILDIASDDGDIARVRGLVEKPAPEDAPSTLSIVGRYVLQPDVFDVLETQYTGTGGEIQLTDAIHGLIDLQPVHGVRFTGRRYDCGDKSAFVAANVAFALERAELAPAVSAMLDDLGSPVMPRTARVSA